MTHYLKLCTAYSLVIATMLLFSSVVRSQDLQKSIPLDPNVRSGKLANGLKYYIRHNSLPEKRVEFRLAVNAGSVQEDNDQLGLAHLNEHMAFNGTKNFPKNELIHSLQSVGVQMGPEINAFTSFDETVYMLTIPTDSVKAFKTGLKIMEDWASAVTFDSSEIDKERGIVIEEWRLGRGAWDRMFRKELPVLFKDSKYADRNVIGTKEILESAKYDVVRRFYKDWYRPDLMAFIVVGDVNVDDMEKTIKDNFGKIPAKPNERKHETYKIPDNTEPLIVVASDKENPFAQLRVVFKTVKPATSKLADYRMSLVHRMFTGMINLRLNELTKKADPPFTYVGAYFGDMWARTRYAYQTSALVPENGIERGIQSIMEENKRVLKYGFTQSEFERYKKTMLTEAQNSFNEREKTESGRLVDLYVGNFLRDEPVPGAEFELDFVKQQLPGITLAEVNSVAAEWITDKNRMVILELPEKEGVKIPKEAEIADILKKADNTDVKPYTEKVLANELMKEKPKAGSIVKERRIEELNITEWTLSNGAKVVLKPTTLKNDEIKLESYAPGGHSVYSNDDFFAAQNADRIVATCGVGEYSSTDIQKILSGRIVQVNPFIDTYKQGTSGSCASRDLEAMLQLNYLYFTQPRKDETAYESFIAQQKSIYKNILTSPTNYFFDQAEHFIFNNHPRANYLPTEAQFNSITLDKALQLYKDRFSDANEFTFIFVGTFKPEEIKPLVEIYIASLPSKGKPQAYKDLGVKLPAGITDNKVFKGSDPKTFIKIHFEKDAAWSPYDEHVTWALSNILTRKYFDVLREDMSGIYGMMSSTSLQKIPSGKFVFDLLIPCAPENADKLVKAAFDIVKQIQKDGVSADDLKKEKETERRQRENELQDNGGWEMLLSLVYSYQNAENFDRFTKFSSYIDRLTSDDIKNIAIKYIDFNNYGKATLYPEIKK